MLTDCEISSRHVRGVAAVFIVGDRALTDEERAALLAEYIESYGTQHRPAYLSAAGWQTLEPQTAPAAAAPPAVAPTKKSRAK